MKKLNNTHKAKLKLSRETLLSITLLEDVQGGGGLTQTKGIGCEPSGIRACE